MLRLPQHVADATDGVDQAPLAGRFDLSSQMPDVNVERVGGPGQVEAPDEAEELVARQNLARVRQEELEQRELRDGELDGEPGIDDFARCRVEREVGKAKNLGPGRSLAAEECAEPGEQLDQDERFRNVVVGACGETTVSFYGGVACAEQEQGYPRGGLPKPTAERGASAIGLDDVDDDRIGCLSLGNVECFRIVGREEDVEPLA